MYREVHSGLSDIICTETCRCRISGGEDLQKDTLFDFDDSPINLFSIVLYCVCQRLKLN